MKKKALLTIEIEYDDQKTDAESVAMAADKILQVGSGEVPLDEYGNPTFFEFFVADDDGVPTPHGQKLSSDIAGKVFDIVAKTK